MTDQNQVVTKAPNALGILLVVCTALFFGVVNTSAVAVVLPDILRAGKLANDRVHACVWDCHPVLRSSR